VLVHWGCCCSGDIRGDVEVYDEQVKLKTKNGKRIIKVKELRFFLRRVSSVADKNYGNICGMMCEIPMNE
jgi:hypothetical protein